MKVFTNKNILQKIIIAIVIVILFNFIVPNISRAAEDWGGALFTPIQTFVVGIGDAIMYLISATIEGDWKQDNIITLSTANIWETIAKMSLNSFFVSQGNIFAIIQQGASILDYLNIVETPASMLPDNVDLPIFTITPEKIFANQVPFLDVNVINPYYNDSAVNTLRPIVSSWYIALRNLALIIMLSLLVYVGIRIIISSNANDKAKYKQMITDWIVAICLLFFMHYIMSFSLTMVEELTKSINESIKTPAIQLDLSKYQVPDNVEAVIKVMNGEDYDKTKVNWVTDFTGLARFRAQLDYDGDDSNIASDAKGKMAYTIIYAVLVVYTVMFLWQYLKRLVYIIFLTMIAPLVAMTYPIDKMNDGSAQAFNMWLKEYIFTLLLQPFHLLLYSMLIGTAIELATEHLIYTLVVLGFLLPAEKLLRKFFGFEKAGAGASFMSGAVGGAMVMNAIGGVTKAISGGSKKGGSSGNSSGDSSEDKVRWDDRSSTNKDDASSLMMADDSYNPEFYGDDDNQNNINTDSSFPDDDMRDYYNNPQDYLNDSQDDPDSIDIRMAEIEGEDYNYTSNPEWMSLNEQKQRQEQLRMQSQQLDLQEEQNDENRQSDALKRPKIKQNGKKYVAAALPILGKGALKAGKGLAKAYGAATLGTIGVAAGLASENYANVFTYGATGIATGAKLADAGINRAKTIPSNAYRKVTAIKDDYMKNLYKDDPDAYKQYKNDESDKAFMKDKKIQQKYMDEFNKDYKKAMEAAMVYRQHGVTDNDVIIKAMKANVRGVSKDYSAKQRIAAAKCAKEVANEKDIQTMSDKLRTKGNVTEDRIQANEGLLRKIKGLNE